MWRSSRHTLQGSLAALLGTPGLLRWPSEPASRWPNNSELHFGLANHGAKEAWGLGWVRDKSIFLIGCSFLLLPEPQLTEHLQKCLYMTTHRLLLTVDDPHCSSLCVSALITLGTKWSQLCHFTTKLLSVKIYILVYTQSLVADSHRIQNQVVSVSLLNSVHTLSQSPTFVLPGNDASLYIVPQNQNINTAVSGT